ncbi:Putative ankyrin repeat domain-containing protein 31, partial [Dryobates pubescens]
TRKRNANGETQLHVAARRGDLPLVKALISCGICVNDQDYAGWTAIHEACSRGFTEVISELLKAGADVNSRSLDGILPIHDAVHGNYLEVVKILLQHGANPYEKDDSGKSALDQACNDQMKELLKSYSSMDSAVPVETTEITERRYSLRSRTVKRGGCNFYKNDALESQHEKYSVSVAAIQDAEKKQKELLLFELRTSKDADVYTRRLSQTQDTLNKMLAKQKTERDTLAKKYRASVESFKKGELRKQLVNLGSRQKSLLTVVQKQEELVQKIQNYRKTKQVFSASCSEKQISISHGNDKRQNLTADAMMSPDVVTFNMGLGASMHNGNHLEAHHSSENQECSQDPHVCFDETAANKDAIRCKEASDHSLASKNRVREDLFSMSKLTNAVKVVTLPSEPAVSTTKTKCSQQKDSVACVTTAKQGDRSLNPTSVTNTLNTVKARSSVVNVCQPGSSCQQVLADEDLHRHVNKEAAAIINSNKQQQQQQVIFSFNANSVLTDLTSNTDYPVIEKSSQSYSNHRYVQNQVRCGRRNKKKLQLIDLLELGRIKSGENVLEFTLQEFSHKATLLKNGKIRTSRRQILQNPVQWVKDLLGSDIYVSWQYAWNKVTYLGTQLSKFCDKEVAVSSDWELPSQERESLAQLLCSFCKVPKEESVDRIWTKASNSEKYRSSVLFTSVEGLTHFLQFHEIVMVCKEEFLPCPVMEKHWSFYRDCEDFGF